MKTGRIVEARTLLTLHESALSTEEWQALNLELEQQQAKAETMIAQAEALEISGKTEEAKALYESVLLFAVDFPDTHEQIKRLNEALLLTKAVKRRSQRIRETSSTPKQGAAGKRLLPLLGAGVAAGLAVALLLPDLGKTSTPTDSASRKNITGGAGADCNPATRRCSGNTSANGDGTISRGETGRSTGQEKISPETLCRWWSNNPSLLRKHRHRPRRPRRKKFRMRNRLRLLRSRPAHPRTSRQSNRSLPYPQTIAGSAPIPTRCNPAIH